MTGYDSIYRRFFSHPEMVMDLLRRFVGGRWVERLDPDSLTMLPAHYVAEELQHREQDLVWRVRHDGDCDLYIYLLLEFQSSVDRFMALRLMVYLGLLYQDLVRKGELTADGLLPPVLPLVLYNGEAVWWAAAELTELIDGSVEELEIYLPTFRYEVIDEVNLPLDLLDAPDSPVAGMFQVEKARTPGDLRTSLRQLLDALDHADLRKLTPDVETWLRRVVGPKRFHGHDLESTKELSEIATMLEERVKKWEQELLIQGRVEGIVMGRVEGRAEGLRSAFRSLFQARFRRDMTDDEMLRLDRADAEEIESLLTRILVAEQTSDIFLA